MAFGHALGSSRTSGCVGRQRSCLCAQQQPQTRVQPVRHRCSIRPVVLPGLVGHTAHHKRQALQARRRTNETRAASDIALSGPSGHADSVRVPESGLLKSSWLRCRHDSEIFGLAIPALGSILLDPLLSLVDTGKFGCFEAD